MLHHADDTRRCHNGPPVKLLFVGDIVGSPGRHAVESLLPGLRERHEPDFVVVNGENSAGGLGITEKIALALYRAGVDAITLGNHAYRHAEVYDFLDRDERIVRPANYPKGNPGRGHTVIEKDGMRLAVVNLSGTVFLDAARSPFAEVDAILAELRGRADHVLVDFHAEATSEKVAMGWYLDGRVTACVGTHTHVPDRRRARAPGRHRLHHRRGHDRPARRRDRRAEGARRAPLRDDDAGEVRDGHRRPVAERRADRGGRRRPRYVDRADPPAGRMSSAAGERAGASSRTASATTATSTRSRTATTASGNARPSTRSK